MTHAKCALPIALALAASLVWRGEGAEPPKAKMPVERVDEFRLPFYDDATGDLLWEVRAAKVAADAENPRLMRGTGVRIIVYRGGKAQNATGKTGSVDTETRSATLQGDVVLELADEQTTRIETDEIAWEGKAGTAWTRSPVKISRPDGVITGVGMRVWLTDTKDDGGKRDRTGHAIIEQRVRVEMLPGSGAALLGPQAKGGAEPVVITCDGPLAIFRTNLTATYRDNVRATQGAQTLTCDRLVVAARPAPGQRGKAELQRVEATGHVRLDDAKTIATADAATWDRDEGSVRLVGAPAEIRWDNGNRLTAGLIQRTGDGAEILCSGTPEHPHSVYLLAYTFDPGPKPRRGGPSAPP